MSRRTLALVAHATNKPLQLEEIQLTEPQSDEAIVEIHAVGICHLELAVLHGVVPLSLPAVLGHEGAGIVKHVGSNVQHVQTGDKVILSLNHCGSCKNCKEKRPGYCDHNRQCNWHCLRSDGSTTLKALDGSPIHGNFCGQSSFSRVAIVNGSSMVKIPQETDLKLFAPLGCGIQTGAGVVFNTLNLTPGSSIAVFGVGTVGISAIMAAKIRGARTIIAIDLDEDRLTLAKELGATHVLNGGTPDLIGRIHTFCPLPTGVQTALDTTGVPQVIESMIEAIGVRGRCVVVGVTAMDKTVRIQPLKFLDMGKHFMSSVLGDSNPDESIPYLIEQHEQGKLPLEKILKHYNIKDFATAIEDMKCGKAIKPVLVWDSVDEP